MARPDRPAPVRFAGFLVLLALAVGGCVCGDEEGDGYPDVGPDQPHGGNGAGGCAGSCVEEPTPCGFDGDPRCSGAEACTLPQGTSCEALDSCVGLASCEPVAGPVHGLYGCDSDADCATGRCVTGACLWICSTDADCPEEFACHTRELGDGLQVRGCVGVDLAGTELPGLYLCHADPECRDGDVCRILAMPGNAALAAQKLARCVPEARAGATRLGGGCVLPQDCRSGLCALPCDAAGGLVRVCGDFRCSQPCASDADCSSPYVCGGTLAGSGVGGRTVDYCTLPQDGCFDDASCCPEQDAAGGCTGGWRPGGELCRIEQSGMAPQQRCRAPAGLLGRFEPCARDADCASGLCAAGVCSSPCVPEEDECASTPGAGSCLPTPAGPGPGRCIAGDVCGDGFRTGAEACDGADVGVASCGAPDGGITAPWCTASCAVDESPCGCTSDAACPHGPCDPSSSACGCWHSVGPAEIEPLASCLELDGDELIQSPYGGAIQTAAEFCESVGAGPCISTEDVSCGPGSCDAPVQTPGMVLCRCVP